MQTLDESNPPQGDVKPVCSGFIDQQSIQLICQCRLVPQSSNSWLVQHAFKTTTFAFTKTLRSFALPNFLGDLQPIGGPLRQDFGAMGLRRFRHFCQGTPESLCIRSAVCTDNGIPTHSFSQLHPLGSPDIAQQGTG